MWYHLLHQCRQRMLAAFGAWTPTGINRRHPGKHLAQLGVNANRANLLLKKVVIRIIISYHTRETFQILVIRSRCSLPRGTNQMQARTGMMQLLVVRLCPVGVDDECKRYPQFSTAEKWRRRNSGHK